jgi:hypothetical protein
LQYLGKLPVSFFVLLLSILISPTCSIMPSDLAIAGSPPDYHVPALNIFSYLFSNPFVKGSHGQTVDPVKYHGHDLEAPTRPQKAAFIDGETGEWSDRPRDRAINVPAGA